MVPGYDATTLSRKEDINVGKTLLTGEHHDRPYRPAIDALQKAGAECLHADFATNKGIGDFTQALKSRTDRQREPYQRTPGTIRTGA